MSTNRGLNREDHELLKQIESILNNADPYALEYKPESDSNVEGEYVEGAWCGPGSNSALNWCPDLNVRHLIWRQDDFVFVLQSFGDPDNPDSLNRQEMITLASQLTPNYQPFWLREPYASPSPKK